MPEEPDVPASPELPEVPSTPEVPDEPAVPEEPSPPEAPSRFTNQDEYVPEPTVRVGDANCKAPVPELYVITSHSWKLLTSYTMIIDCAGE